MGTVTTYGSFVTAGKGQYPLDETPEEVFAALGDPTLYGTPPFVEFHADGLSVWLRASSVTAISEWR